MPDTNAQADEVSCSVQEGSTEAHSPPKVLPLDLSAEDTQLQPEHDHSNVVIVGESSTPSPDVVRTLFITGFPKDARYREIYNFFRFWEGFVRCDVNVPSSSQIPVAFVLFEQREQAEKCIKGLSGVQFDPDIKYVLRLEFAKANTVSRKRSHSSYDGVPSEKRQRVSSYEHGSYGGPAPHHQPHAHPSSYMRAASPLTGGSLRYPPPTRSHHNPLPLAAGNTTLFVANLAHHPNEQEVAALFQCQEGFRRIRFGRGNRSNVFVEFMDTELAARAMHSLQGHEIAGATLAGGLRIEVARSRMGMPSSRTPPEPRVGSYYCSGPPQQQMQYPMYSGGGGDVDYEPQHYATSAPLYEYAAPPHHPSYSSRW